MPSTALSRVFRSHGGHTVERVWAAESSSIVFLALRTDKMLRVALFAKAANRGAMFARRGRVNQNPPPKMSRIYREDRSMEVVVHNRTFLVPFCQTST